MTEYEEEAAPDYADDDDDDDDEHLHHHHQSHHRHLQAAAAADVHDDEVASAAAAMVSPPQPIHPLHPSYYSSLPDYSSSSHMRKRARDIVVENPPHNYDVKPALLVHHYDTVDPEAEAEVSAVAANAHQGWVMAAAAEAMGVAAAAEEEEVAILRSRIASHPLFPQLLDAHLACLHALPVSGGGGGAAAPPLPASNSAAAQQQQQLAHLLYPLLRRRHMDPPVAPSQQLHLDHFMVSFVRLLQAFHEQLREQAQLYCADAMAAVTEIASAFVHLTGEEITSTDGSAWMGATANGGMTDDEMMEEEDYLNLNMGGVCVSDNYDPYMVNSNAAQIPSYFVDGSGGNFNNVDSDYVDVDVDGVNRRQLRPPLPTSNVPEMQNLLHYHMNNNERSLVNNTNRDYSSSNYNSSSASADMVDRTLMHHIRKELKLELKQNYRPKLTEVRDEILRKRRAAGGRQPKGQNTRDRSS